MDTKIIHTREEEEYYRSIWHGGARGGVAGFAVGLAVAAGLHRFYPPFRQLPMYIKSTFAIYPGIVMTSIGANLGSHAYQSRLHPKYLDESQRKAAEIHAKESKPQRVKDWLYENRLHALGATWAVSMAVCLERMRRDPYTATARKVVQARVFAQVTTVAAVLILAALEAKDKREGRGKYQKVLVVDEEEMEQLSTGSRD